MLAHALIGRHVRAVIWDDLADLMPGGLVGRITEVTRDFDEIELTVRLRGFKMPYIFLLGEVELLPPEFDPETLHAGLDADRVKDEIRAHPCGDADRIDAPGDSTADHIAGRISGDGRSEPAIASHASNRDSGWVNLVNPQSDCSVNAYESLARSNFVE